jgi:PAT family beta-lactamase induction signal transducer AmpG
MVLGIPGLVMLARFVPPGTRDPDFSVEEAPQRRVRRSTSRVAVYGIAGGVLLGIGATATAALLSALKAMQAPTHAPLDYVSAVWRVMHPSAIDDWIQLAGIVAIAMIGGLFTAAWVAVRHASAEGS